MPLLGTETSLYPEDLFAERGPGARRSTWWVLHTRPRTEKALARTLLEARIDFFLPLYTKRWRNRDRAFASHLPLFPGYLFVHKDDVWSGGTRLREVLRVLPVPDQDRLQADLTRVYKLLEAELTVSPEERLQPGTPVRIEDGPLAGLEGRVLRRGSGLRFFVEVDFLQKGMSAEVEGWTLRPLGALAHP